MKIMNIGIVGAGFIAYKHAEGIREFDNVRIAGVMDVDRDKQKQLVEKHGGKAYESFEEMLADPLIDIVDICLPTQLHYTFAMQTIKAKKALFLEKPMALSYQEAKEIADAAKENDVPLMVGQSLRFKEEYMVAKELILSGKLGRIKQAYAARLGQRPSWRKWSNNLNIASEALYDLGLHDIDYLFSLFGDVDTVYATGVEYEGIGYENIFCTLNFKNGVKAVIDASDVMTKGYPFTMVLRVDGTEGTLEYRFSGGENTEICTASKLMVYITGEEPREVECTCFSNHGKELSYFAECIEENKSPEQCLPSENVKVIKVLEKLSESMLCNKIMEL